MTELKTLGAYSSTAELYREAEAQLETQSKRLAEWEAAGIEKDSQIGHLTQQLEVEQREYIKLHEELEGKHEMIVALRKDLKAERTARIEAERQCAEQAIEAHDAESCLREVKAALKSDRETCGEVEIRKIEAATIERCAKVCENGWIELNNHGDWPAAKEIKERAQLIRALAPDRTEPVANSKSQYKRMVTQGAIASDRTPQMHGDRIEQEAGNLEPAPAAAPTLGKFDQTEINAKAAQCTCLTSETMCDYCKAKLNEQESLRLEGMEQAAKIVEYRAGSPSMGAYRIITSAADAIRAEIARRRESPTEQLVTERVGLRGPHVG